MSNEDHTSDDLMADAAQSAIAIKYPTSPSLQTPRRSSLSPVKTDRALKDSINIAIYELVKDHGDWTWQMIANEVNAQLNLSTKTVSYQSVSQRYSRTVAAYDDLTPHEFEAMRRDTQATGAVVQQQQLAELVNRPVVVVDVRNTQWHDVADFVNIRLFDAKEHLSAAEAQSIAEGSSNVRYHRLVAAAVARQHDKYWQDVADLVNFQLEAIRDGKLSAEQVEEIASRKD